MMKHDFPGDPVRIRERRIRASVAALGAVVAARPCARGIDHFDPGDRMGHRGWPWWRHWPIPTFLAAIPVFATARGFGRATLTIALVITVLGVLGVLLGLFICLPAAILLFLAWLSDPGPRPRIPAVLAGLGYALVIAMTVIWGVALAHPV